MEFVRCSLLDAAAVASLSTEAKRKLKRDVTVQAWVQKTLREINS
jgi:hypothetical protein